MPYLCYLERSRRQARREERADDLRDLEIALSREMRRVRLEGKLHSVLYELNLMTGMRCAEAFDKSYEDAKRLADV